MDKKKNRLTAILDVLKEHEMMSVKELSDTFGVSEMTIRRDLEELQRTNVIERSHGGAKMKFSKFDRFGLFVKVPTKIYDRGKRRHIRITTIWRYDKKEQFHFITAIPRILED